MRRSERSSRIQRNDRAVTLILKTVHLVGFRNFKNATINLNHKSLIIGPNDIGKSNFLRALRLLLDRNLPDSELDPNDSDFFAFDETNTIAITLHFIDAKEDCIKSKFHENIGANSEIYIQYLAIRDPLSGQKNMKIKVGPALDNLKEYENRFYLKVLNLHYIGSNRDLNAFIRREKKNLLGHARDSRTAAEIQQDDQSLKSIEGTLDGARSAIASLNFISKATGSLNSELASLSVINESYNVEFDTGASDIRQYIDNLTLASSQEGKTVALGGDGKNNQVYLAIWSAQRKVAHQDPTEVSINCIEEPEAHLHPHQQRKLAHYLSSELQGQVLLTSHSPHIASEFEHQSIISLQRSLSGTVAANSGCSSIIKDSLHNFGHRLNVIPAEGFFSNVVFLVEGVSEVLFYKALAKKLNIDLDKYNISIIPVQGVGFDTFIDVYLSLGVRFVLKTDLDIFKVPNQNRFRAAGLQRGISVLGKYWKNIDSNISTTLTTLGNSHESLTSREIPQSLVATVTQLISQIKEYGIFFSNPDLETDLATSALRTALSSWYGVTDLNDLIQEMKVSKGERMFSFLNSNFDSLYSLSGTYIAEPLAKCVEFAKSK